MKIWFKLICLDANVPILKSKAFKIVQLICEWGQSEKWLNWWQTHSLYIPLLILIWNSPMEYLSQNTWIHLIDVVIFWDQILLFIQFYWLKLSIMWCFNIGFQGSRIGPPVHSHSEVCSKHIPILPLPNQTRNISRTGKKRCISIHTRIKK